MKLHLPVLLRAALLSAFVVSSQGFAGDYQNGSLVKENQTGTIYNDYSGSFALNSYEALTFHNNVSVIYGQGSVSLLGNGDVLFQGNQSKWDGPAISAGTGVYLKDNKSLAFSGNIFNDPNVSWIRGGGAISLYSPNSRVNFEVSGNDSVLFSGNRSTGSGGAIYIYGSGQPTFNNNGTVRFENNALTGGNGGMGGGLFSWSYAIFEGNDNVEFVGNTADGATCYSGALYARAGVDITGTTGQVLFDGNSAGKIAGAFASGYWFNIEKNGDVVFSNNTTLGEGAAVYVTLDYYPSTTKYLLSADYGNVTFKDNFQNTGNGGANKSRMGLVGTVYKEAFNQVDFEMRAAAGKSIFFYDPFYFTRYSDAEGPGNSSLKVHMNSMAGYSGNIVVSGQYNEGRVLDSYIAGAAELYEGSLSIVDKGRLSMRDVWSSTYGSGHQVKDTYFDFRAWGGSVLEMRRDGAMVAKTAQFDSRTILRTGSGASLAAASVNMQSGITFDIAPFLNTNVEASGLTVTTESWSLGGHLFLSNNLDFNGDSRWATNQNYLLMTDANGSRNGQTFSDILIYGLGTNVIGDGYAYQGTWSFSWNGNDLYAHWTVNAPVGAELWWDGEGAGHGNGIGVWNQVSTNKVWNKDMPDGVDWAFQDLDVVHFTRSGDVTIKGLVSVNGNVKPSGIIEVAFNGGNGDLLWHGDGSIVGNASIEKYGTGKLVIRTENSFSGGTKLYGGTIRVDTKTGLGTGGATIYGGLLDLGERGVENDVTVVGNGALAGIADGHVLVKTDAVLNFLAGTWFRGASTDVNLERNPVVVEDKGTVNVQAGTNFAGHIELTGNGSVVNFVEGNGGTSQFSGTICGNGSINVLGGNHEARDMYAHGEDAFTGTLTMYGGKMTIASPRVFSGPVHLLGGTFIAGDAVRIGTVTVGNDQADKVFATVGVTPVGDISKDYLWADSLDVKQNATLNVIGALNVLKGTTVQSGGMIEMQNGSTFRTMGYLTSENKTAALPSGGVVINEGCAWNANGGFGMYYVDARTGNLTIGSDSIIKEQGYFYAENTVYGTDKDGNLLPAGTPADKLPTLTISKGATLWAGNTVKHAKVDNENNWYQTITGFFNVTLDIDALANIGTFVIKGDGDGKVTHEGIVDSMKRAFTPKLVDGKDLRTYLYVLRAGIDYSTGDKVIQSNETIHVEQQSSATVGATSGAIVNLGGELKVNQINETGTVTASGGNTDLVAATGNQDKPLFMGSFGTVSATDSTAAQIKLNENAGTHSLVTVDTVQAQTGERTVIGSTSNVNAQNFIVAGADTKLDNQGGALVVDKEVKLEESASYAAGDKDRFGWVNLHQGNLDLTRSSWEGITLGSYAASSGETEARVRLDESKENNLDANELHVIGNDKQTNVVAGTRVSANKLIAGKGSHLEVKGGEVNVRQELFFDEGVAQSGTVNLVRDEAVERPVDVVVTLSGNNQVGNMNSAPSAATFVNKGFNNVNGYSSSKGRDTWVFVMTDAMLANQNEGNAIAKIAAQEGNDLSHIALDTSQLTQSYTGDIQLYSDNITLRTKDVDYGEATGVYNQKDAIKNFVFVNPVVPDLQESTINSLWTMTDAMDAFSSAVSGQLSLGLYRQTPQRHLWGKAFYLNENIGKALRGYRKDSGGYAIGYDDAVSDNSILGGAFGQIIGSERTNRGLGKTHQDIMMGMVYGRTTLHACDRGLVAWDYMAGYGSGRNRGKFFRNGNFSTGRWNSDSYNLETQLTWYRKVGSNMSINPYVGLEFVLAQHDAHTFNGGAGDFAVDRSRMHALRLPIGATFEHTIQMDGKSSLTNYFGASYVPDLVRRNPKSNVANGNMTFTMLDSRVGRHAVRGYVGSSWQIDEQWNVNLHYEVEAASQKVNQTARLGTSYSF